MVPTPLPRNYTLEPPWIKKVQKKKEKIRGLGAPRPVDEIVKNSKISKITFWQLTTKWRASEGGGGSPPPGQELHAETPVDKKGEKKKRGRGAPRPVDEIVKKSKISKITVWQLTTKWRASEGEGGLPPGTPRG